MLSSYGFQKNVTSYGLLSLFSPQSDALSLPKRLKGTKLHEFIFLI